MRTTNIRFTGLASGLDTESIVQNMLVGQQNKINSTKQQTLLMELKRDKYKEVSGKVYDFTTKWASKFRLTSAFSKNSLTVSDDRYVNVSGSTSEGVNIINSITSLAKPPKIGTTAINMDESTSLEDLGLDFKDGSEIVLKVSDGLKEDGSKDIKEIVLTKDMTLSDLAKKVNSELKNTNFSYDNMAKGFFASGKKTGESSFLDIEVVNRQVDADGNILGESKDTAGVLNTLGLSEDKTSSSLSSKGSNMKMMFNNLEVVSESNTVTVNGVTMTVKSTFSSDAVTGEGEVTISSEADTSEVFTMVKDFIGEYNKLIEELNKLTDAKPNNSYKPLLDEQKKEMSESDIEAWNKKIDDALLSGDQTIRNLTSDLREIMGGVVSEGAFNTLTSIGVSTGNWRDKGKLVIDETKLQKAISENSNGVIELFTGDGKFNGIVDNLYTELDKHFKSVADFKSSQSIFNDIQYNKMLDEEKKKLDKLELQYESMESSYFKKFTAMEKMMQQLNNQSSWLSGQLGGM